ncbi:hypothetical protein ACHMW5_04240 [Azospirillum melinis]|uniref:hypothetical protein n=1 Tax=Azospirillum melinis TaxID=328839 RepID=UPI003757D9F0
MRRNKAYPFARVNGTALANLEAILRRFLKPPTPLRSDAAGTHLDVRTGRAR